MSRIHPVKENHRGRRGGQVTVESRGEKSQEAKPPSCPRRGKIVARRGLPSSLHQAPSMRFGSFGGKPLRAGARRPADKGAPAGRRGRGRRRPAMGSGLASKNAAAAGLVRCRHGKAAERIPAKLGHGLRRHGRGGGAREYGCHVATRTRKTRRPSEAAAAQGGFDQAGVELGLIFRCAETDLLIRTGPRH